MLSPLLHRTDMGSPSARTGTTSSATTSSLLAPHTRSRLSQRALRRWNSIQSRNWRLTPTCQCVATAGKERRSGAPVVFAGLRSSMRPATSAALDPRFNWRLWRRTFIILARVLEPLSRACRRCRCCLVRAKCTHSETSGKENLQNALHQSGTSWRPVCEAR